LRWLRCDVSLEALAALVVQQQQSRSSSNSSSVVVLATTAALRALIRTQLHHLRSCSSLISSVTLQQCGALQSTALNYYWLPSVELQHWVATQRSSGLHISVISSSSSSSSSSTGVLAQHTLKMHSLHSALRVQGFLAVRSRLRGGRGLSGTLDTMVYRLSYLSRDTTAISCSEHIGCSYEQQQQQQQRAAC
jgi:hypothetical protein